MPAPSSLPTFLDCLKKSGVVDSERLEAYLKDQGRTGGGAETPGQLAEALVRDGILTCFQAEQLLLGKWRNFLISGKYRVLERLGAGGMATVYLCEHVVMRRRAALKVLPAPESGDARALERFHREARAAASLKHPNIVAAYDVDHHGKLHFLVMEYVEGIDLYELVKRQGRLSMSQAADYIRQAALGLQHAFEAGLV